jgi:GntR family transcriptional regulator
VLWAQLLADLRRRLADQEFDADFPGEPAVAAEYAVSRHTVRQALGRGYVREGAVLGARGRPARVLPLGLQGRSLVDE